jgi:hypothetical protein
VEDTWIEAVEVVEEVVMNQDQWHALNVEKKVIWQENVQILVKELKEILDIAVEAEDKIGVAIEVVVEEEAASKETLMTKQNFSKVIGALDILVGEEVMKGAVIEEVVVAEEVSKIKILIELTKVSKEIDGKITIKETPRKMKT